MRKLLIILIICIAVLAMAPSAFACSGVGRYFEYIANYDTIVAATVMDVDDVGIGTVLKVDRYFKGAGDGYLAIMQHPPALQHAGHIRRYDTGCTYAARRPRTWQKNDFGYLGLSANSDGTYSRGTLYSPQDGFVEFYSKNEGDYPGDVTLPVEEFEQLLLVLSGKSQTTEALSNPYPLMRFLNITTESGKRYRLNPDRSVTWLDSARYPMAISNDGSHVMFQLDDGELGFQYLGLMKKPFIPIGLGRAGPAGGTALSDGGLSSDGWLDPVKGSFGKFSPNSDFVIVQEETRLAIYLFYSTGGLPGADVGFGYNMTKQKVASFNVSWLSRAEQQPLVWSADSKVIAFQDKQGIWLWKVLEESEPQLVVPDDEGQQLLELSYSGRYLRFGNDASWTLLDDHTGESWTDTLISPDESRLIEIRIELADEDSVSADVVQRRKHCSVPLSRCPLVISAATPRFIFWHDPGYVGLVFSTRLESFPWKYSLERLKCRCSGRIYGEELPTIIAFAFDEAYRQPVFAFEETNIGFDFDSWISFDSIDLGEYLDSPIAGLEWGQPIFYEGH